MLSLFFPNIDALRLALATGIIPAPIARTEVSAATGHPGGFWVQAALGASHWAVPLSFWRNSPQYMGVALGLAMAHRR